jgi:hypothetical protein
MRFIGPSVIWPEEGRVIAIVPDKTPIASVRTVWTVPLVSCAVSLSKKIWHSKRFHFDARRAVAHPKLAKN